MSVSTDCTLLSISCQHKNKRIFENTKYYYFVFPKYSSTSAQYIFISCSSRVLVAGLMELFAFKVCIVTGDISMLASVELVSLDQFNSALYHQQ